MESAVALKKDDETLLYSQTLTLSVLPAVKYLMREVLLFSTLPQVKWNQYCHQELQVRRD